MIRHGTQADTPDQRLRKRERLTRRSDYAQVYAQKRNARDGMLAVYVAENGLAWSRIGLSVGKRTGKAVQRQYLRRRIREAFRLLKSELPCGLDIIVVVLGGAKNCECDVAASLHRLVRKAAETSECAYRRGSNPDTQRK